MNPTTYRAFADELEKIAMLGRIKSGLKSALSMGWHGDMTKPVGHQARQSWWGQGRDIDYANMSRPKKVLDNISSLGGFTRNLPIGAKTMMAAGAVLQGREALRREDPTGQGRSRAERMTGVAANTVGGLIGAGALLRTNWGKNNAFMANILGGMGGGLIADRIATAPFRALRNRHQPAPQPMPVQQEPQYIDPNYGEVVR